MLSNAPLWKLTRIFISFEGSRAFPDLFNQGGDVC